jgi:hypothetical protein
LHFGNVKDLTRSVCNLSKELIEHWVSPLITLVV